MRLPNGFGSVVKLSGNRRRPYVARKTIGYTPDDKSIPIYLVLGYFAKRSEGITALTEYNKTEVNHDYYNITVKELFDMLKKYKPWAKRTAANYQYYYDTFFDKQFGNALIRSMRHPAIQKQFDDLEGKAGTQKFIKNLWVMLFDKAKEFDIVKQNYARYLCLSAQDEARTVKRKPFGVKERENLFKLDTLGAKIIIVLIYLGPRIREFFNVKESDVDIEQHILMIRRSKTDAGVRVIPIHDRIMPIIESWLTGEPDAYLIKTKRQKPMSYTTFFKDYWTPTLEELKMQHTIHDTRHTLATMTKAIEMDNLYRKLILGHKVKDITDGTYTHVTNAKLVEEINKLR